ncbi:phosphoribosylanthranilate isomerase [Roseivirga sp. E12]|uniref:phosphoribosylanthranilate isomerase n=1 Tax=Roseivirga sp. E12 TaxID=2819237 RepID=UPI001ABCA680|nr:phosphoribosylanthranilate isomerase [Roseivirga sp. E12]MBO3700552.1 phosphoribosylanthranilate isomerase [Roseivirga sp. E12]
MKLKVCGMRESENIAHLLALKPDYIGFIFYDKSPRDAQELLDTELLNSFPKETEKIGVFVNADLEAVKNKVQAYGLDYVQLHGDEPVEYTAELFAVGIKVIKVFSIGEAFDFSGLDLYNPFVDFFLFDTKGKARGGNGEAFDWEILKGYNQKVPFFLSGGIDLDNVDALEELGKMNIHAIDVNSKFELAPGLKDIERIEQLTSSLRGTKQSPN